MPPAEAPSPIEKLLPEPVAEQPLPIHFQEEGLQEAFDERAAIFEFDAGLPRHEAEAKALEFFHEHLSRNNEVTISA